MVFIAELVHRVIMLIILVVFIQTILTFFLSPFHPIRQVLDRFVEPMLAPIRRVVPLVGMLDFSPWILMILLQILDTILTRIILSL